MQIIDINYLMMAGTHTPFSFSKGPYSTTITPYNYVNEEESPRCMEPRPSPFYGSPITHLLYNFPIKEDLKETNS